MGINQDNDEDEDEKKYKDEDKGDDDKDDDNVKKYNEKRDKDLDPSHCVQNPLLIENIVKYKEPLGGVVGDEDEDDTDTLMSAHIKIMITEMQLDP